MMIFAIIFVLVTSVTAHVIAAPNPGLAKRGIVYEADCDDAQDKLTQPALYDVEVIANNVLNGRLPDGTAFADSTAYVHPLHTVPHLPDNTIDSQIISSPPIF